MKRQLKSLITKILKKFGLILSKDIPSIVEITEKEKSIIKNAKKYSMTTEIRMWSLINSLKKIVNEKIDGDIVECGIWRGGNIILINKILEEQKIHKKIYCYDTFEGMDIADNVDKELSSGQSASKIIESDDYYKCKSSLDDTKKIISQNVEDTKDIIFIKGKVEDTLMVKKNLPKKISICRLDTDYYSSTKIELEILYPLIEPGGILIIDDYGHWSGCKKAVDEYFKDKYVMKHFVDYACRLIIKR
jgi:hypothetical protein